MRRTDYFSTLLTLASLSSLTPFIGCGTTRSSDTGRIATEQLLISDAIDRAVQSVHFGPLAGQSVYVDSSRLNDVVDRNYLVSTLRQHLLASGCALRDKPEAADFIVEVRAGAVGTDRNDLLFGVPSMNVPQILPVQPVPAAIPEIPVAKRRDQRGVAKIAVFAYHRESGAPVWQSGVAQRESSSNDVWILGAGPFQRGTIYEGTEFAGSTLGNPTDAGDNSQRRSIALANEQLFTPPARIAASHAAPAIEGQAVQPAKFTEPVAEVKQLPQPQIKAPSPPSQPQQAAGRGGLAATSEESLSQNSAQRPLDVPMPKPFDPLSLPRPQDNVR
jgi:hypothetical protein